MPTYAACQRCGQAFRVKKQHRMFCSRTCYNAVRRSAMRAPVDKRSAQLAALHAAKVARIERVCLGCGLKSGRGHWCMTCRLFGKHHVPVASICSRCGSDVPGIRNRKYCDTCWRETMSARRGTARRTDANHVEIVSALRAVGCSVMDLSHVGRGCPDILVSDLHDRLVLIEIKTAKGKLNRRQLEWHEQWRGGSVVIVRTVDEALRAVGADKMRTSSR